ncbi:hypothetical protein NQ317_004910 [Molorchus minor]|uniref:Uncharacterized protein n=1 Tax=Molorchus minor TaxID=1323400 RepID=A0ABQ9JIB5_9CUCU|nr:hypothetical protein NQ317_004910 [Molorchus minor]
MFFPVPSLLPPIYPALNLFVSAVSPAIRIGKGRGHLILTGTAGPAVFDSPVLGPEKDVYNISWSVNSHSPITEYRLFYRQQPRHHHGHHQEDARINSTKMGYRSSDWNSVVIPVC